MSDHCNIVDSITKYLPVSYINGKFDTTELMNYLG